MWNPAIATSITVDNNIYIYETVGTIGVEMVQDRTLVFIFLGAIVFMCLFWCREYCRGYADGYEARISYEHGK